MPPSRDRRWVLLIPAAVLALGALTAWWIVTPDAFAGHTGGEGLGLPSSVAGEAHVFGGVPQPTTQVTLASARPLVEGAADVRVVVCDAPIGVVTGSAEDACDQVSEVEGAILGPERDRWLVIEVTPSTDEPVVVRGLAVAYTQGLRFGRQVTGQTITLGGSG